MPDVPNHGVDLFALDVVHLLDGVLDLLLVRPVGCIGCIFLATASRIGTQEVCVCEMRNYKNSDESF
jgi:hypothetical protein